MNLPIAIPRTHPTRQLLMALHEETLGPEAIAHWQGHLASCAECRAVFDEFATIDALLMEGPAHAAPFDFAANVMAAIPRRRARPSITDIPFELARESVAPLVLAAAGIPFLVLMLQRGDLTMTGVLTWSMAYGLVAMAAYLVLPWASHPPHLKG